MNFEEMSFAIIRAILALLIVGAFIYLIITGRDVDQNTYTLVMSIIVFYFGLDAVEKIRNVHKGGK